MKRARRSRRLVLIVASVVACVLAAAPSPASAQEKKRPHADSGTPFVHRIQLRDEQDNPITPPKLGTDPEKAKTPAVHLASLATTCGKCHDYHTINLGWHFNAPDPSVAAGRAGEPWILTDDAVVEDPRQGSASVAYTRTQLPLSYRHWPGTWTPAAVGMSDWKFAYAFGRQWPGGGPMFKSTDQRFNVTGALQNDCLICHVVNVDGYDGNARYEQIVKKQNFKYAPLVAAGVGEAKGTREKLKDNWTPPDPNDKNAAGPPEPAFEYDLSRFNPQGLITFDISRRVPNERCYFCHTSLDGGAGPQGGLNQRWRHDRDIHLVKGMLCVDCHRHGLDHMVTRGYPREAQVRHDPSIVTLTCEGCHYGAGGVAGAITGGPTNNAGPAGNTSEAFSGTDLGGRNAAPRPVHKGLPIIHFDKLECTACHSGPYPSAETTQVLTSMAHRLGTESYNRAANAAPQIQEPVFLRDDNGKIAPHKVLYP
ncbi:MAG TPA: hypothetical protein VH475_14480, partial [Tepidisphaeraceae bacterium]